MLDLESAKKEIKARMLRRMPDEGSYATGVEGVGIHRRDVRNDPHQCLYGPRIIYILQGCKHTTVGNDEYCYGENDLFLSGVDLPNSSHIMTASPEEPCMSLTIDLDRSLIGQLALEFPMRGGASEAGFSLAVQPIDAQILDAFLRLEAVFDNPDEITILGPMILREIHFRLLSGPNGNLLRSFHTFGTQKNQVSQAIGWLKKNYKAAFRVEDLAEQVHMAPSTFHRHFKEVTSLSPLQFQKRLRLHEAQRLMLADDCDVAGACEKVGYESLPQFTREYRRLFGEPPRRNVTRWQGIRMRSPALSAAE